VLGHSVTPALWFDIAGAALLSAANPPLDAARLDIMPAPLWVEPRARAPSCDRSPRRSPDRVRAEWRI